MQIPKRFTVAIHICVYTYSQQDKHIISSEELAKNININAVIIRNLVLKLKEADIIQVNRGRSGGIRLKKKGEDTSFLDIYRAVQSNKEDELFDVHKKSDIHEFLGQKMDEILRERLFWVQTAMENELAKIKIADLQNELVEKYIKK